VPHLSYVGDVEIGEGSNIGAATVVVNYDGVAKHRTKVGDHVRIGSDTMPRRPVTIGDGAYTGRRIGHHRRRTPRRDGPSPAVDSATSRAGWNVGDPVPGRGAAASRP